MIYDTPFRDIPRQSALFLEYIDLAPSALRFYQRPPTLRSLEEIARSGLKGRKFPRAEIAAILRRQNKGFGSDVAAFSRIDDLENPGSVAIVTGQQVGIFGGPLYTIYKAITAIKLANALKERGIPAAPIFWMDTEDHDLGEVSHATVMAGSHALPIDFRNILFHEINQPAASVGSIVFSEKIRNAAAEYCRYLPEGAWKAAVRNQIESAYKPGESFSRSFGLFMSRIFEETGLILFDPQDSEAKQLASPLFQNALSKADAIHSSLVNKNHELESAGFHAQVKILDHSTVLFFMQEGRRRALEKRGTGFALKGSDQFFSLDELLQHAAHKPADFSPNVLLRPLVQDHLFPTIAYVGGSAEVAYFAQIEALYKLFDRPMPVIWPRNGFTLIEPEVGESMDRFGLKLRDCFKEKSFLMENILKSSGFSQAGERLEELQRKLDQVLADMRPEMESVESPLAHALDTAHSKINHNLKLLKSRIIALEASQHSGAIGEVDLALNHCYPNQNLQEREFSIHPFLARHGLPLLEHIRQVSDPENFHHRTIRL